MGQQEEVSAWLLIATTRVLSPLLGAFIVIHETLAPGPVRLWLLALAGTGLGYPVADWVDGWLATRKNGAGKD